MVSPRHDPPPPSRLPLDPPKRSLEDEAPPPPPRTPNPLLRWVPLALALCLMPAIAYAFTSFVLLPKLQNAVVTPPSRDRSPQAPAPAPAGQPLQKVPLRKMIVNVAGTQGSRYLLTSVTLVGAASDFPARIEQNKDHLLDLATGTLAAKTIADLEKPGARNQIRTELLSVFNTALGENAVQELYITELAIQ